MGTGWAIAGEGGLKKRCCGVKRGGGGYLFASQKVRVTAKDFANHNSGFPQIVQFTKELLITSKRVGPTDIPFLWNILGSKSTRQRHGVSQQLALLQGFKWIRRRAI